MPEKDYLRHSPVKFDDSNYQACYAYWLKLKGDRRSPRWDEWDWMALPVELIPYFLVVDVYYDPRDFIYRFYGTASVTMHNKDFTGLSTSAIRSPITARTTNAQYDEVVASHEAIGSEYQVQAGADGPAYVQTSLRMPFSNDGQVVTQIATYADWSREIHRIRKDHIRVFGEDG